MTQQEKLEKFIDNHVESNHHTKEQLMTLFGYIVMLFEQGRNDDVERMFIKN